MTQHMEMLRLITVIVQGMFVFSNLLGLPGNIVVGFIALIWAISGVLDWQVFFIVFGIVAAGEALELLTTYFVGRKYGVSNASFVASIIGSLIGGIFGAGLLLGIGAVPGTFLGAFLGTYLYEYYKYSDNKTALNRGFATFVGRFIGSALKIALGIVVIIETWKGITAGIM